MSSSTFFNAHHSPVGAFASFTLGQKGPKGGLGLELSGPANEAIYIGIEDADAPGRYIALPFVEESEVESSAAAEFDVEGLSDFQRDRAIRYFSPSEITRDLGTCVDEWKAGDLSFRIYSPAQPVPDPESATPEALKLALVPAVLAQLTIDNRKGTRARKAFFGYSGSDRTSAMRMIKEEGIVGIGQGLSTAIITADADVYPGVSLQAEAILDPKRPTSLDAMLGHIALLVATVPSGELRTFQFAVSFFKEGTVTTGMPSRYLYRRWFDSVESVGRFALASAGHLIRSSMELDSRISKSLSEDRYWMLSQAIRSYFGSTECLELRDGRVFWVVNEGEYRMMNTFDLTIDQAFFELCLNPWTVRNELDFFIERYSYVDQVRFPGDETLYPGGLTFTHDMGITNSLSDPGHSSYEQSGLKGCFSYMSCEELLNWILTAALYVKETGDEAWLKRTQATFVATLNSLVNRDHPVAELRNGLMGLDSSRCEGGAEITTYDSLDESLGQARNNVYLGVKAWAAYVAMVPIFEGLGIGAEADLARSQALLCAKTVVGSADAEGFLPAVIGEGVAARIIPAIEGLIYPQVLGLAASLSRDGEFGELVATLDKHFRAVLHKGICLFPDGAWKLSSSSKNSWLSKIYLCQSVAESVLGHSADVEADAAHRNWLLRPDNAYFAWSDQILDGTAVGSKYYPRGVTGVLWLRPEGECGLDGVRRTLIGA